MGESVRYKIHLSSKTLSTSFCSAVWKPLLFLLFLTDVCTEALATSQQTSASILSSSDTGIRIQVLPGSYPQRLIELQGEKYVLFEGIAASQTEEGKPLLPTEGVLLGVPLTANVSLEVISYNSDLQRNQLIAPIPRQSLDEERNAFQEFILDKETYSISTWYPSRIVELEEITQLRNQKIAKLLIYPYQYNPATRELKKITSLIINVRFDQPRPDGETKIVRPSGTDPYFEDVYESLLLNYEQSRKWRGTVERAVLDRSLADPSRDWFDPNFPYLKLHIVRDGIYKLTQSDLALTGINLTPINPRTFRLFNRGIELPLFVAGESDGVFDSQDYLEFHAQRNYGKGEFFDLYTDTNAYWLTYGGIDGLRMVIENTDTAGTPALFYEKTRHFEEDRQYYFGYNELEIIQPEKVRSEGWYWSDFFPGTTTPFSFSIPNLVAGAQPNSTLRIRLGGMSQRFTTPDHLARITLNGTVLGQVGFDFNYDTVYTVSFPTSVLREGTNTLTVQSLPTQALVNKFYLDWFEVSYPSAFAAISNEIGFVSSGSTGPPPIRYTISGFQSSAIEVYRLSDRRKITGGRVSSGTGGTFSITFRDTGTSGKSYFAVTESQKLKPSRIERKNFKDIRSNSSGADYIIIAHELFRSSAERLAAYRTSLMNVRPAVVDIQAIYDEFNYGIFSPEAIKAFLRFAYEQWPRPAPAYVLLFGDASWDFKSNFSTTTKRNFIPAYGNPPTDNWFVAFDSTNNILASMFIGRIPVENVVQADQFVEKLIKYDGTPLGEWTKSLLFITGGNTAAEKSSFNGQAEFLISNYVLSNPVGGFPYRVYKTTDAIIDGENKQLLQDILSNGTIFLNFIGHSGGRIWGVDAGDPNTLRNTGGEFVFVTSVSCNVAAFADPRSNVLTEDFLFAPGRAAIAGWAGSSLGYVDIGFTLSNSFLRSVSKDSIRNMGKLTTIARIDLWRTSPLSPRVIASVGLHPLLGDPAANLALPRLPDLALSQADLSFDPVVPTEVDSIVRIKARIRNYGLVPSDSIEVKVSDTFAGVTDPIGSGIYRLPPPRMMDSLSVRWNVARKSGNHIIGIAVDPSNRVPEVTKANNQVDFPIQVFASRILAIRPIASSVVPRGPQVLEVSSAVGSELGSLKYFFEVDTSLQFNSSTKIVSPPVDAGLFIGRWSTPALTSEGLYYWRSRTYDGRDTSTWMTSTFVVSDFQPPSGTVRWAEIRPKQFFLSERFRSDVTDSGVTIARTGGIPLYVRSVGNRHDPYREFYSVIKVIDQVVTAFNFWAGSAFYIAEVNEIDGSFSYRIFQVASQPALADSMARHLQNISADRYIVITVVIDGYSNNNENLYRTLESLGATQVRSVRPGDAWAFIAQKRTGFALESISKDAAAEISYTIPTFYNLRFGSITSSAIGPARRWQSISWTNDASGEGTDISLRILGLKQTGELDTLAVLSRNTLSQGLTTIDTRTYPMLKLYATLRSDLGRSTPILKSWMVEYEGPPDPAIGPQTVGLVKDSVLEGEAVTFTADVHNIGYTTADSLRVNFYFLDQANVRKLFHTSRVENLEAGRSKTATAILNTAGLRGPQNLVVELNTAGAPELYTINNVARRPFYVQRDTVPPLLEVTFDGLPIVSGDYVSANPNILIKLRDNSPLPIPDTANVTLRLNTRRIHYAGNPQLQYKFPPAGAEKAEIQYQPELTDGFHTLVIEARDASGNLAGRSPYRVDFVVRLTPALLDVYTYPNPFSNETYFTFNMTGSTIPDDLTIKVYTVAGRLIRTIPVPVNSLRIGFNRFYWDGRDNDGNEIANGVYFYTMVLKNGDKTSNITQRLTKLR